MLLESGRAGGGGEGQQAFQMKGVAAHSDATVRHHPSAYAAASHTRSQMIAMPCPPPMQAVARP